MQSLDGKEWEPRAIQEVFTISPGKRLESRNREPGKRPFIGALDNSNGVVQFVSDTNESLDCNVLGVNYNGNGMGIGFYHPYECVFSDDVKRFHLKNTEDCKELALFTKALIAKQRDKFGYLYKFNAKRMAATSILLPVTASGEPDYEYMAEYTRQKRNAMLAKYRAYVESRIAELGEAVEIPALDEKEWAHFKMPQIFRLIQRGKRLKNADHAFGTVPYVSSTANNNGVDDYIEATPGTRVFGDCISLANSGSVGTAFYEPFDFVASDHVTALKTEGISKYCYLFMTAIIEKQGSNFNFNREINDARIKNMQIMLPVTDSGEPDYEYMEQYAKNMMLRKYQQYLTFLQQRSGAR